MWKLCHLSIWDNNYIPLGRNRKYMTNMFEIHNNPSVDNYGKDVPRKIEIPEIPLDQILRNVAQKFPDNIAVTYFTSQLTYKKIDELVDRLATALLKMGLQKGDTVALHFTNVPNCIVSFYGVIRAGGKVTLLSPLFKKLEITYQLKDSEARFYIMWDAFDQINEGAIPENVEKVIQSLCKPMVFPRARKRRIDGSFRKNPISRRYIAQYRTGLRFVKQS